MGSLTALDIIVLTLVGGGAVLGFSRGLVQEVSLLLAWVLAIAAVRFFHPLVTDLLAGWVGTVGGAVTLAFVLLFGGVGSEEDTPELQTLMISSSAVFCIEKNT